jgi:hypothetical protein
VAASGAGRVETTEGLRHWVFSAAPVVSETESEEDWRAHLEGIEASLTPVGHLELSLARRIADLLWRMRRITAFETESMVATLRGAEKQWMSDERFREGMARIPFYGEGFREPVDKEAWLHKWRAQRLIPEEAVMERVLRYEAHLHRQLLQTMHELEALQARRLGDAAPLARLDVAGPPGG